MITKKWDIHSFLRGRFAFAAFLRFVNLTPQNSVGQDFFLATTAFQEGADADMKIMRIW